MPQLDPLLKALLDRSAEELILADGDRPSFRFGVDLKPVSQTALSRRQIASLLGELADEVHKARLAEGLPTRFGYRLEDGRSIRCDVAEQEGTLRASLMPGAEGATEAAGALPLTEVPAEQPAADSILTAPAAREPAHDIDRFLFQMLDSGASDLHLSAGEVPQLRVDGEITPLPGAQRLREEQVVELLGSVMPERNIREYRESHDTDFAYEIPGRARFRVNVFRDRKGSGSVIRVIPMEILTAEDLGLGPAILDLCRLTKGLVLVTGPTGSGKSTTLAAMVDFINRSRSEHIITIEDPIEFVHQNRKCLVNQREVVTHTKGFKPALRAALREDPDIVLVGEMRDLETIAIAIETAETGHLVFGTLHTTTACSTVDRIIDQFSADRQAQVRTMLASSLRGVISQTLLRKNGGGRTAALEVLIVTPAISNLIREGKTFQIPSLMQTGKKSGMCLLNDALFDLVKKGRVDPDEAYAKAVDKTSFASQLRSANVKLKTPIEP